MKDDRKEELKSNELSFRDFLERSDKEIERVYRIYRLMVGAIVTIVITSGSLGAYFYITNINAMKADAKAEIETLKSRMERDYSETAGKLKANIENNVSNVEKNVRERINQEFDQKNIRDLVQNVAHERIENFAVGYVEKKIRPEMEAVSTRIGRMAADVVNTQEKVHDMERASDFAMVVLAAQNDDRDAFDKLKKWAEDSSFPVRDKARDAWVGIVHSHNTPYVLRFRIEWEPGDLDPGVDQSKPPFDDLKKAFYRAKREDVYRKPGILQAISERDDIPIREKMEFFLSVMKTDKNLRAVEYAGRFFRDKSKQTTAALKIEEFNRWWQENSEKVK